MTAPALTRAAAAKINLTLEITGRRADGYHTLDSLVAFTEVEDLLSFSPAPTISMELCGPHAGTLSGNASNLVQKAAQFLQLHLNTTKGVAITLEKNIPVAAGLGGGSADAAATLDGCLEMWGSSGDNRLSDADIASALGADVPVCRFRRAAMMRGIGEEISGPVALPSAWVVLVNPRVSVQTQDVFKAFSGTLRGGNASDPDLPTFSDLAEFVRSRGNSLAEAALKIAPAIGDALGVLKNDQDCAVAQMSGSGATCFGLFDSHTGALRCAAEVAAARPEWWVHESALKS
jgi:4-diphosphocytidyl-2-C-methyl-D-erythritol kinase